MKTPMFDYFMPTKLFFGEGELKRLAGVKLPGKKALVVISAGTSMRKFGYLDKVLGYLKDNKDTEAVVFDKILPNPIKSHVMEAAAICRKHKCDFVIGLGGGSTIDSAKSIAVMAVNDGDYWDYISGGTGKSLPVKGALPVIAIPTTAGTGTESDPWTVITHEERQEKIGFGNAHTFPMMSFVDPELMISVPPMLTAYQGFDAFFHAAEGYIANISNPMSDIFALKSIDLLYKYLPRAVKNGNDMEARTQVALASMISGMVESTSSCTSEHSMEHAMSAIHPDLPHGAGLIAISKAYFTAFADVCPERYMQMAEAMTGKKSKSAKDFINALTDMQKQCGVGSVKLSDWGITKKDLPDFVKNALDTMGGLFNYDPRRLSEDEILSIYKDSYK